MWSCTDTRYFERSQPLLRVSRHTKVSYLSPIPGSASLWRRWWYNLQRLRQKINSARRFIRLQRPARHSGTAPYRRRRRPEFGILHPLELWRNPMHSPGFPRHTQVTYLNIELVFIFILQGLKIWVTFKKPTFIKKMSVAIFMFPEPSDGTS